VASLVAILAIAGVWRWDVRRRVAAPSVRALAVLPFRNLSGDVSQDYFADASRRRSSSSSEDGRLRVIARTTAMRYRDTKMTFRKSRVSLGWTHSCWLCHQDGGRVRVTAELFQREISRLWARPTSGRCGNSRAAARSRPAITTRIRSALVCRTMCGCRGSHGDPEVYERT